MDVHELAPTFLAAVGALITGYGSKIGYDRFRRRNGKADHADVVVAIDKMSHRLAGEMGETRKAIYEQSEKMTKALALVAQDTAVLVDRAR